MCQGSLANVEVDSTYLTSFPARWCNIIGKTAAGLQWHRIIKIGEVFADEVAVGGSDKDCWGLLVILVERLVLIEGLVGLSLEKKVIRHGGSTVL